MNGLTHLLEDPHIAEIVVSGGGPVVVDGDGVAVNPWSIHLDDGSIAALVARLAVRRGGADE